MKENKKTTTMEESDKQRYIQDQVNIEIEHVRSWPTKAMAFYIVINFGIISGLITLQKFKPEGIATLNDSLLCYMKPILAGMVIGLAIYMYYLLRKLNDNYVASRKMQIKLQNKLFNPQKDLTVYGMPDYWFKEKEGWRLCKFLPRLFHVKKKYSWGKLLKKDCDLCKYPGWLFYVFVISIVTSLVITGIFTIGEPNKANLINSHPIE